MVKVLIDGGPYFRVPEPYTPEEAAYFHGDAPHPYGEDYSLGANEWPPGSPESEAQWEQIYKSLAGPVTFYGGSPSDPHRKSPTIGQGIATPAGTSEEPRQHQPEPAKRSSRP